MHISPQTHYDHISLTSQNPYNNGEVLKLYPKLYTSTLSWGAPDGANDTH